MHQDAEHAQHAMHNGAEHAMHGTQPPSPTWLTIAEAAAALGVSVDTVRRRLKRGELVAEQTPTERGPVWRVAVDVVPSVPSTPGSNGHSMHGMPSMAAHSTPGTPSSAAEHAVQATATQQQPELLKVLELLERAQADVVAKAEAAAMWQARAEYLMAERDQLAERVRALPAPSSTDTRPGHASEHDSPDPSGQPSTHPATPHRPWWHFW